MISTGRVVGDVALEARRIDAFPEVVVDGADEEGDVSAGDVELVFPTVW